MNTNKPKLIIFASGSKDGGGSGFENLVNATKNGILNAEIVGVVSNHENGGVRMRADKLGIKFIHFPPPWKIENDEDEKILSDRYKKVVSDSGAEFVALSGWLKMVVGLDPKITFNIHPGPIPRFGGPGMYGHHVHEAVVGAYKNNSTNTEPVTHSAVTMHFVTPGYDRGPVFFAHPVLVLPDDTAETLAKRVNEAEHMFQPVVTNQILNGEISWDGSDPQTLKSPYI